MNHEKYTPYEFGHKIGRIGKYGAKYLCLFVSREDRIEFCKGYSDGIDAAKRQREVKRP